MNSEYLYDSWTKFDKKVEDKKEHKIQMGKKAEETKVVDVD